MIPSAISSLLVERGNLFQTHLDRCGAAGIRDSDSFQQSLNQECGVCIEEHAAMFTDGYTLY